MGGLRSSSAALIANRGAVIFGRPGVGLKAPDDSQA
jgi:hypothetical protein